eukprot:m.6791 g.6791  ORF g.6791 m.6791 type:complete len:239 (+) comp2655_c0_seq1:111-827(+)
MSGLVAYDSDSGSASDSEQQPPAPAPAALSGSLLFFGGADSADSDSDSDEAANAPEKRRRVENADGPAGNDDDERDDNNTASLTGRLPTVGALFASAELARPDFLHCGPGKESEFQAFDKRAAPKPREPWKDRKKKAVNTIQEYRPPTGKAAEAIALASMHQQMYASAPSSESQASKQPSAYQTKESKDSKNAGRDNMSFNEREKRKRERGQAARDKSYVEEEKRLLRQSGGSGFGFD